MLDEVANREQNWYRQLRARWALKGTKTHILGNFDCKVLII